MSVPTTIGVLSAVAILALLVTASALAFRRKRVGALLLGGAAALMAAGFLLPALSGRRREANRLTPDEATSIALMSAYAAMSDVLSAQHPTARPMPSEKLRQAVSALTAKWDPEKRHKLTFGEAGQILDGWGRPLRFVWRESELPYCYSVGPNGKDERGDGDDVSWGKPET